MTLIILFIAFIIDRIIGDMPVLRSGKWFYHYRERMVNMLPVSMQQGLLLVISVIAPPVLILLLLQNLFSGVFYHFFDLLLSLVVLLFSFSAFELNKTIQAYLETRELGEDAEAWKIAEKFSAEPLSDSPQEQSNAVATGILYQATIDIFCVIFWFLIMGPAGALLYKMATLMVKQEDNENAEWISEADTVWGILGWVPFRLVALSFFLAGSFDDAFKAWHKYHRVDRNYSGTNREILIKTGCGAMRREAEEGVGGIEDQEKSIEWVQTARQLVFRTLVIWFVCIAILTLGGLLI